MTPEKDARRNRTPGGSPLVGDRDTAAHGLVLLQLVHERYRVVLGTDAAVALGVGQELVAAHAERAGPLAGRDRRRGRDVGPVQVACLSSDDLEEFPLGECLV